MEGSAGLLRIWVVQWLEKLHCVSSDIQGSAESKLGMDVI